MSVYAYNSSRRKAFKAVRSGSLIIVSRKLGRYKLDLVGVQEVRWDKRGTVRGEDYIFFYGKGNEKKPIENRIFCTPRKSITS
jgi:hypothetical protein